MSVSARLSVKQTQSLVMTPQLQQAIKLLQLSNLELADFLEGELERNPLLERVEEGEGAAPAAGEAPQGELSAGEGPADGAAADGAEDAGLKDTAEITGADTITRDGEDSLDSEYQDVWSEAESAGGEAPPAFENWGAGGGRGGFDGGDPDLENAPSRAGSLRDHLIAQIGVDLADPADRVIALHLADLLDDSGYLADDLAQVATRLGADIARVEATLAKVQRLDPPGVFARSLAECLALQLAERDRLDPAMQILLDNLDLLGRREVARLRRLCGVDAEDLSEMVAEIRALDPKPGLVFDTTPMQPVVPDVTMRAANGGGWIVELNNETLPRVLVDRHYYARVTRAARDEDERTYIAKQFQAANWLVKSLDQRATTILKVAAEIGRQQEPFFLHGIHHLKPLVLRDIAEQVELHESTVSRVTSNKYMATPRGVYELKYFFTSAIQSAAGGDALSAESVRHRIRALIDAEAPDGVLSDDRIVATLRRNGVDIARRTVAKYREAMRIPSSVQRRREKMSGL